MSELCPLPGLYRKSRFEAVRSAFDPTEIQGHLDLSRKMPTLWLEHHGRDN